jgi:perosamine synthetase
MINLPAIPLYSPTFGQEEMEALGECMNPDHFGGNDFVTRFEQRFAAQVGAPEARAIAVMNGTVALHLAALACELQAGDEVILPALTFVASANAISYTGATPVLVDVESHSWQMSPDTVRRHISSRTRAIMAVHLYGHACDTKALRKVADEYRLHLIEDCAEALGTTISRRHVGLDSDVATFSFYKNKTITTGEGGLVLTQRADWADRIVLLKGQGVAPNRRFWHELVAYNYRMSNLSAALGMAQLARLPDFVAKKRALAARYRSELAAFPMKFQDSMPASEDCSWLVAATMRDPGTRDDLASHLQDHGIETRPVFLPLQRFPMYSHPTISTPVADQISACGLCLPSWPGLSHTSVSRVIATIADFFRRSPKSDGLRSESRAVRT